MDLKLFAVNLFSYPKLKSDFQIFFQRLKQGDGVEFIEMGNTRKLIIRRNISEEDGGTYTAKVGAKKCECQVSISLFGSNDNNNSMTIEENPNSNNNNNRFFDDKGRV